MWGRHSEARKELHNIIYQDHWINRLIKEKKKKVVSGGDILKLGSGIA